MLSNGNQETAEESAKPDVQSEICQVNTDSPELFLHEMHERATTTTLVLAKILEGTESLCRRHGPSLAEAP